MNPIFVAERRKPSVLAETRRGQPTEGYDGLRKITENDNGGNLVAGREQIDPLLPDGLAVVGQDGCSGGGHGASNGRRRDADKHLLARCRRAGRRPPVASTYRRTCVT